MLLMTLDTNIVPGKLMPWCLILMGMNACWPVSLWKSGFLMCRAERTFLLTRYRLKKIDGSARRMHRIALHKRDAAMMEMLNELGQWGDRKGSGNSGGKNFGWCISRVPSGRWGLKFGGWEQSTGYFLNYVRGPGERLCQKWRDRILTGVLRT